MAQWIISHAVLTYAVDECECELHYTAAFSPRNEMYSAYWIWGCCSLGVGLEKVQVSCCNHEPSRDLSTPVLHYCLCSQSYPGSQRKWRLRIKAFFSLKKYHFSPLCRSRLFPHTTSSVDNLFFYFSSFLSAFVDVVGSLFLCAMTIVAALMITLGFLVWCDEMTKRFPS